MPSTRHVPFLPLIVDVVRKKSMKDYNIKELRKRVSEVLYYLWDPIGVSFTPEARGEYEGYVDQLLGVLHSCDGASEISTLLSGIRTKSMGLPEDTAKDISIAQLLQNHKKAVLEGLS